VAGVGGYLLLHDLAGPVVTISPNGTERVGPVQDISLVLHDPSAVRAVRVTVKRQGKSLVLVEKDFQPPVAEQRLTFNLREAKLPEGAFELEIKAWDASWSGFGQGNSTTVNARMRLDSQPPRIAVLTAPPAVRRGGSALIVYTVGEETNHTGVQVGDYFFPGHRQANGAYACLFPFPYTMNPADFSPRIMARDLAGNTTSSRLLVNAQGRKFQADTVTIGDRLLTTKADELAALCPDQEKPLDQYICVNNRVRVENDARLLAVGQTTSPVFLWEGNFQRLPRSAVKATFGDHRTYVLNGKKIDEQIHTGLDLASVAQADIPASQHGRVVMVERVGIYGNVVVIDHGLGLMTLYAHLTETSVAVGDEVKAGQKVGTTGVTGLAVGDHVHFAVLVGGIPVQPLEWLDPKWVQNNISSRMKAGS